MKPPFWISAFSYVFIFIGIITIAMQGIVLIDPNLNNHIGIGFLTKTFYYTDYPKLFIFAYVLFILAGVTGLAIVARKSYAYDIGIMYSVCSLIFFGVLTAFDIDLYASPAQNFIIQFIIFSAFLFYLVKNRMRWIQG